MPYFSVKMPDGRYTVFSTVVDSFVAGSMTRAEAVAQFALEMSEPDAEAKVGRADARGGARWNECLRTIRRARGEDELRGILEELGQAVQCWTCCDSHTIVIGTGEGSHGQMVTLDTRCPDCTNRDGTHREPYKIQRDLWKMPKDALH